ncbi:phosphotransferase [Asanoa sp. WMMD1127]|uniref:phosphotransferase n=1 Tax=Asanoa sp. WMMD1127 TaxID=3016107 RepID=UPI002417960A|nr:phosphotransferase [Asanoa sp. WMMD1127]MDG4824692.1 phosphotransferase [Asanoa sp. WMMD1127]
MIDSPHPRFADETLRAWRVTPRRADGLLESRSGAGVRPVTTAAGAAAYAKLVPAALGPDALAAARRELRFYRELAPTAPVRTPALLDHVDTAAGVALLLADAGRTRDVRTWTIDMWASLGRDLAALHTSPSTPGWIAPDLSAADPGWATPDVSAADPTSPGWVAPDPSAANPAPPSWAVPDPSAANPAPPSWVAPDPLGAALAAPDLAAIRAFWAESLPGLDDLVARLRAAAPGRPSALIHGDCHTENITVVDGALIFCDWQSAGLGRPATDLAFVSVRATPAGVTMPDAFLDAYPSSDPVGLRRAVLTEELATLVFLWPPFAAYNSQEGVARVRARGASLARRWRGR